MSKQPLKAAFVNFNGTTGKTTLGSALTSLSKARFITIETRDEKSDADLQLHGGMKIDVLATEILAADTNLVVDFGVNDIESMIKTLAKVPELMQEFDVVFIPVTLDAVVRARTKQMIDTLKTMHVEAKRIVLLPNRIPEGVVFADEAPDVIKTAAEYGVQIAPAVSEQEFYSAAKELGEPQNPWIVAATETDWRKAIKSASSPEDKLFCTKNWLLVGKAKQAAMQLQAIFFEVLPSLADAQVEAEVAA